MYNRKSCFLALPTIIMMPIIIGYFQSFESIDNGIQLYMVAGRSSSIRESVIIRSSNSRRRRRPNIGQILSNNRNHRLWPNGIIPYQISKSLQRHRSTIIHAMRKIEQTTCISFQQRQLVHRDYLHLTNGDGCHSIVGRLGGRQTVSLGNGCHDLGSVIHELCHAIGLYHEHMRYDRDHYLQIHWSNIQPEMMEQFVKIPISEYNPANHFDYNSIMIYGSKAFSKNGGPTMIPRDRRIKLRESYSKRSLSQADITNINALYEC